MPDPSAVRLYATRLRQLAGRRPSDRPTAIAPDLPPGRVVSLPDRGDVFVREQDGPDGRPPILLLHGWLASAELNWFGTFDRFEGERRVVALDHRGHGRGMHPVDPFRLVDCADDAAALLDVLGIERAIVAGFSMGGPISLLLAARHPRLVAGLVPASTALVFNETLAERLRWRFIRLLELGVRLGAGDRLVARLAFDWGRVDERFAPHTSWLAGEFSRTLPRALREAGTELSRFDARPWAADLDIPAAMVVTGRDSLVPDHRQRALAAALDAPEILLGDQDHDAPITAVDRFADAIHRAVSLVDEALAAPAGRASA
ncbi:alpha/beta fold hydrolase [Actinomarinicola tropica]|uniref:Alpha/beta fold hydrolase n=1 Tax=Actinomarinicola tropica TaxID=2789776 RepID=A0A5Q2RPI5_9ACTN|nr:alpha/beta hydrolase [Actinomarinicola tropica]QGG95125.1 alpha/beta fold hydrolase [Actinomarinicola tropica]